MTSKELNEKSYEVKISCTILRPIPEMPFWIFLNVNVLAIHTTCVVGGGGGSGGGRRWFGDKRCAFVKVYKANNLLELVSKFGNVATTNGFLITKWLSMVDRNNIMK